jgi:hypothetical protein
MKNTSSTILDVTASSPSPSNASKSIAWTKQKLFLVKMIRKKPHSNEILEKPNLINRFSHVKFLHDNIRTNYFLKNDINECFIQEITHMHDSSYLHFPTQTTVCYQLFQDFLHVWNGVVRLELNTYFKQTTNYANPKNKSWMTVDKTQICLSTLAQLCVQTFM